MTTNDKNLEIGDDLEITKTTRRAAGAGTWVCGRMNGHRFDALVFPAHAENADYELGDSRISKLWVQRLADKTEVANFDRGWDVRPTTDEAAASGQRPAIASQPRSTHRRRDGRVDHGQDAPSQGQQDHLPRDLR
ncbi:MAG: hypothetical protein ACM3U2_10450 [Deltaproteobacteria bacterium]